MKKKLVKIANQIISLERKLQAGENMAENMKKLEDITSSLSPEELFEIDEYLTENFMLNKK